MDKSDSAGILDHYFPQSNFFIEFERFDRFLEKYKRENGTIDYFSVCTPNYLHDADVRFGLKHGADVICEKPLALNPWNVEALEVLKEETGREVFNVLQLRLHPSIQVLKKRIEAGIVEKKYDIDLAYITPRG